MERSVHVCHVLDKMICINENAESPAHAENKKCTASHLIKFFFNDPAEVLLSDGSEKQGVLQQIHIIALYLALSLLLVGFVSIRP